MPKSDIEKEVDAFVAKIEKDVAPQKASGEAIVSEKKGKAPVGTKSEPAAPAEPTFDSIGIDYFETTNEDDQAFGMKVKPETMVKAVAIPSYAEKMSPSLQIMAKVVAEPIWGDKWVAVTKDKGKITLAQACVKLAKAIDDYGHGQSKDWGKIKQHGEDQKAVEKANELYEEAKKELDKMAKEATDEAVIAYLHGLPIAESYIEVKEAVLKKFPLLSPSSHLQKLIIDNCIELQGGVEPVEIAGLTDYSEEINAGYPDFLKSLVDVVTVLDETKVGPVPNQPISLYKVKGKWKAGIMPLVPEKKELPALPPGPEGEEEPKDIILTPPVKISSPGNMKQATPPTFIPLPPGDIKITKFIWTLPTEVPVDSECYVTIGYGSSQYQMHGTLQSASEAPPFSVDKGGVLKVSLMTKQPLDAWLELELEIGISLPPFLKMLPIQMKGLMNSWAPPKFLSEVEGAKSKVKTQEAQLNQAMAEAADAGESILAEFDMLEKLIEVAFGGDAASHIKKLKESITKEKELPIPLPEGIAPEEAKTEAVIGKVVGKKGKPKGYKPKITAVNINGKAIDAQELADALRYHLKNAGFMHYLIDGSDHEFKKTKGVLMHFKVTWAGDPELNLVKWALTYQPKSVQKKVESISIEYEKGDLVLLLDCLYDLANDIKEKE